MIELIPCPFCGAPVETFTDKYGTWGTLEHKPDCLWYFSNFPKHVIREQDFEKWNTRYERTCRNVCDWRDDNGVLHRDARLFKCSECRYKAEDFYGDDEENFPRYCPNCGAKVVEQ